MRHFTVFTDHNPIIHILSQPNISTSLQQWIDIIIQYDFNVIHRPAVLNVLPDALSRLYSNANDKSSAWGVYSNIKLINATHQLTDGDRVVLDSIAHDKPVKPKPERRLFRPSSKALHPFLLFLLPKTW